VEPIKKNGNLEAFSTLKNPCFYGFYGIPEDNYSNKPLNITKKESNYLKNKFIKQLSFGCFVILN